MTKKKSKRTVQCVDAGDGSGDLIIELHDDILDAIGVKVGDVLVWTIEDSGWITLKKRADDFFDSDGVTDDFMNDRDQPQDQDR